MKIKKIISAVLTVLTVGMIVLPGISSAQMRDRSRGFEDRDFNRRFMDRDDFRRGFYDRDDFFGRRFFDRDDFRFGRYFPWNNWWGGSFWGYPWGGWNWW